MFGNFFKHEDAFFSLFHLSIQAPGVTVAQGFSEKKEGVAATNFSVIKKSSHSS